MKDSTIELLNLVRGCARIGFTELSHKLNMPVASVFNKFSNESKAFLSFKSLLNFDQLGFFLNVIFLCDFNKDVLNMLQKSKFVNTLQICGVDKKILAICYFRSFQELKNFELTLQNEANESDNKKLFVDALFQELFLID